MLDKKKAFKRDRDDIEKILYYFYLIYLKYLKNNNIRIKLSKSYWGLGKI